MNTLYQKVRRYTWSCTYLHICMCVYILHAHVTCSNYSHCLTGSSADNWLMHFEFGNSLWDFGGNVMGEERQCRHETQVRKTRQSASFPKPYHFYWFQCLEEPRQTSRAVWLWKVSSPNEAWGSSCGSAQNGYIQKRGTRDNTSVSKHTSSASQQVTETTCTVGDSSLIVSY